MSRQKTATYVFSSLVAAAIAIAYFTQDPARRSPASVTGADRVTYPNRALPIITEDAPDPKKSSFWEGIGIPSAHAFNLSLTKITLQLIAEVSAPKSNGVTLQATSIAFDDNYVYVGYNLAGEAAAGAVDVFDVSKPAKPVLVSETLFPTNDVNAIALVDDRLLLVGATSGSDTPAYLRVMGLQNGIPKSTLALKTLPSFAANGVLAKNSRIYVTSGDKAGGLSVFDAKDYSLLQSSSVADARAVTSPVNSNNVFVFAGQPGRLLAYDQTANSTAARENPTRPRYSLAIGGAATAEAKSTVTSGYNYGIASLGSAGYEIFCHADGRVLSLQAPPTVSGLAPAKNVTNAAILSQGIIFSANGEGGLQTYTAADLLTLTTSRCSNLGVVYQGRVDFGSAISANHVQAANSLLFVAAGLGGLKIIQFQNTLLGGLLNDFDLSLNDVPLTSPTSVTATGLWTSVPSGANP